MSELKVEIYRQAMALVREALQRSHDSGTPLQVKQLVEASADLAIEMASKLKEFPLWQRGE